MFQKFMASGVSVAIVVANLACSTQRIRLSYDEFAKQMRLSADPVKGEMIGPVHGDAGGALWVECHDAAPESVRQMIVEAKAIGASAIGDIKWHATNSSQPGCKKGWGYFALGPFVLTPLFMSARVDGIAYKSGRSKAGLYRLPKTTGEEALIVDSILAAR